MSIVKLNQELQKIVKTTPPFNQMIKEIKMMHLKIKPVFGDITKINFRNQKLLKTLWQIGKIEEFYNFWANNVKKEEKKIFNQMIFESKNQVEAKLREIKVDAYSEVSTPPQLVEMELFKYRPKIKN